MDIDALISISNYISTPRNPIMRAYYEKCKAEGKTSQQALICISRRLISIIELSKRENIKFRMLLCETDRLKPQLTNINWKKEFMAKIIVR